MIGPRERGKYFVDHRRVRHFLCNASMVFIGVKNTDVSDKLVTAFERRLHERANVLFRTRVSRFSNGWEEQLLAQVLLDLSSTTDTRLYHLRSICNICAGFWNQTQVKLQPFTMTWWGTNKPWTDIDPVPKYTDVYLFRYFLHQMEYELNEPARSMFYSLRKRMRDSITVSSDGRRITFNEHTVDSGLVISNKCAIDDKRVTDNKHTFGD